MAPSPHDEPAFAQTLRRGREWGEGHPIKRVPSSILDHPSSSGLRPSTSSSTPRIEVCNVRAVNTLSTRRQFGVQLVRAAAGYGMLPAILRARAAPALVPSSPPV